MLYENFTSAKSSELPVDEFWTIFAQSGKEHITHKALTVYPQVYPKNLTF